VMLRLYILAVLEKGGVPAITHRLAAGLPRRTAKHL
jgi:hypothetical protein